MYANFYLLNLGLILNYFCFVFQLFQQLELQKVFHGFSEGPIGFQPTYKYDPGSDEWDTR